MEKRIKFTMKFNEEVLNWLEKKGTLTQAINDIIYEKYNEEMSKGDNCNSNTNKK